MNKENIFIGFCGLITITLLIIFPQTFKINSIFILIYLWIVFFYFAIVKPLYTENE